MITVEKLDSCDPVMFDLYFDEQRRIEEGDDSIPQCVYWNKVFVLSLLKRGLVLSFNSGDKRGEKKPICSPVSNEIPRATE